MRVVVTGANRGIGLELVRQLARQEESIEAAVRRPDAAHELQSLARQFGGRVHVHACDVSSDDGVRELARSLSGQPVDLLINNAGAAPVRDDIDHLEPGDAMVEKLNVNAVGPLRVVKALLSNLREGRGRLVVHIGSVLGSLTQIESGDTFSYRMSKAALNMASRALALGLREDGIASVVIHPGWVQTSMGGPRAPMRVEEAVSQVLALIHRLSAHHSGKFLDPHGRALRW